MLLDARRQKLLQDVVNGEKSFRPSDDSDAALKEFHETAELLIEIGEEGFLRDVKSHNERRTVNRYIDSIMVGGVTAKGREAAATV